MRVYLCSKLISTVSAFFTIVVKSNSQTITFGPGNTATPFRSQIEGLSPMVEVALAQVETRCHAAGLFVCGYYHANR
jgi:hypothetical protein